MEEKVPEHIKTMMIMFDTKTAQVSVNGPIGDKVMSYGMLEMAKEAIYEYHVKLNIENAQKVVKAASDIIKQ